MLRIFAFVLFIICGAVGGFTLSDKLRLRRDASREIFDVLQRISVLIRYKKMDMYEIVREIKSDMSFKNIDFISRLPDYYEPGTDFYNLWEDSLQHDSNIASDERNCLISFGRALGKTDIEGQLSMIESACEMIKDIQKCRNDEYLQKSKLYKSVGILLGTMTGIIII